MAGEEELMGNIEIWEEKVISQSQ